MKVSIANIIDSDTSFENYKSNVCHLVKDMGEFHFIKELLINDDITVLFEKAKYAEALYLLGMLDYLCNKNNLMQSTKYENLRSCKLEEVIYPSDVFMKYLIYKNESILEDSFKDAIPEFKRYNIVEKDVENIV